MEFQTMFIVNAESWFRGECDFDVTEEGPDKDAVLRAVFEQIADKPLPTSLTIETFKAITLMTEDGEELFKSEPKPFARMTAGEVQVHPIYAEIEQAATAAAAARVYEEVKAAEDRRVADRIRVYEEVKAELERGKAKT